jgi:4-amino-4-deoxy-L-arabinose transferase-like glycosyltransferase
MKRWHKLLILGSLTAVSTFGIWIMTGMTTIYRNYDGPYYVAVAKTWYDKQSLGNQFSFNLPLEYYPAHLPLYPLLISLAAKTGLDYLQAMVAVNLIGAVALVISMYVIASKSGWSNPVWIALATMFFWPRMWAVRSVGSPETIFILMTVWSLYCFTQKKYWLTAIFGSAAILTKSPGVLLIPAYAIAALGKILETKKIDWKMWPLSILPAAIGGLFYFYFLRTGDFWAYFHTGDNIHLGLLPFRIFDSSQPWVGSFWLEDIIWIYLLGGLGVYAALKKNRVWGIFGAIFYLSILFVSHRDISRYSLPLIPIIAMGWAEIWNRKEVRVATLLILIPMYLYTLNFVQNNVLDVGNWAPLL